MAIALSRVSKKITEFISLLFNQYKNTLVEIKDGMVQRPIKSGFQLSTLTGLIYLLNNNPSEQCYLDQLLTARNDLLVVGDNIRNPSSFEFVSFLNQCQGERTLKRLDLGVISLLLRMDLSPDCALYINQCDFLKPTYMELLTERLVDIGVAGRWRVLDRKMIDYDVNPDEWS
ncbi:mitochondrial import inner membrane translocase subunit Tim29-like [Tetranychus urticae]|uniref:mitochondrial import inner membrane translocase subunit Tim29-like n=1 Tax=Tetranychus urticae TaxID=32264 RepID=UPI00077BDD69|nr:mitochondrial import inner membrane translocase subunit Tim29-like [Tetranychus urticae]